MSNALINNYTMALKQWQDGTYRGTGEPANTVETLYTIGHSLLSHEITRMTQVISGKPNYNQDLGFQWGNGRNLLTNYGNDSLNYAGNTATGDATGCWDVALAAGVDALVMVEANVVGSQIEYADTHARVAAFYDAAIAGNSGCDVWIYEGWLSTDGTDNAGPYGATFGGTAGVPDYTGWAASVQTDQKPYWDSIKSTAVASGRNIGIIRAGHALVDLMDAIAASRVPGMTSMADFFVDMVHPSQANAYYLACVVYSYVYNDTPVGKPVTTLGNGYAGGLYPEPTAAQVLAFQTIAWESYLARRDV